MIALFAAAALAATAPSNGTIAIVGGTVYTEAAPAPIENGTVVLRDGKIAAVGAGLAPPAGARVVDAHGKIVTPGLIAAASRLGLVEIEAASTTTEFSLGDGSSIRAAFRAVDGYDPQSALIPVNRMEGITSAVVRPTGGVISGQEALMHLDGRRVEDATIAAPVAIHADLSEAARAYGGNTRGGAARKLREALADARLLRANVAADEQNRLRTLSASRLDLLALAPVLDGKLPLVIDAEKASDIEEALALAREEKIRIAIEGAAEGWSVAGDLAAAKVPVLVDPMQSIPGSFESLRARFDDAALLHAAGVSVVLLGEQWFGDGANARVLPQECGNAVAWGFPHDAALAAVTRVPAELFGVADRIGTLAPGKIADVVVWSGDPFELSTNAEHVFIAGRELPLRSRQTELLERYRTLPPK